MKFKSSVLISTSVYEFKNEVFYLVTGDASLKDCSLFGPASLKSAGKICLLYTFSSENIRPTLLSGPQHGARMWTDSFCSQTCYFSSETQT